MRTAKQAAFMGVTPVPGVERRLLGLNVKQNKMKERSGFVRGDDLREDGWESRDVKACERMINGRRCGGTRAGGLNGQLSCMKCGVTND